MVLENVFATRNQIFALREQSGPGITKPLRDIQRNIMSQVQAKIATAQLPIGGLGGILRAPAPAPAQKVTVARGVAQVNSVPVIGKPPQFIQVD